MRCERPLDRLVAGGGAGDGVEQARVAAEAECGARLVEGPSRTEQRRRGGPERAVAVGTLRPQLAAEGDQLGEVRDGVDLAQGGDADEPVGVEIVAEEQRRVVVGGEAAARRSGRDRPGRIVSRPSPKRPSASGENTASPRRSPGGLRASPQSGDSATASRAIASQSSTWSVSSPTASTVRSMSSSECASETNIDSNWDGAM